MAQLPGTMLAAVLVELGKPLELARVELPPSLAPGQVLVKVHYSGVCGSQLGEIDGAKGDDAWLPHLLGHEGSGSVVEAGPGVRQVKAGDRVVLHWRKGPGIESETPRYRWDGRTVNAGWVTTFNEYAIVSENRLTRIPEDSDLEVATLLGCAVTTGFGVVQNNARLGIGESVVVYGAGGVGLSIVQAAAMVSAYPVVAVDQYDERLELARRMGATHLINARRDDPRRAIRAAIGGGADVFIDNTGNPGVIEMGYELSGARGRVILVGVPRKGSDISIHSLALHFGKRLSGSHGGEAEPAQDIPRYLSLFRSGRLRLRELLTEQFPLQEINGAIRRMRDGTLAGRCLIRM